MKKKNNTQVKRDTVQGKGCVCVWGVRVPSKLSSHEAKMLHRHCNCSWRTKNFVTGCLFSNMKIICSRFIGRFLPFAFFSIFTVAALRARHRSIKKQFCIHVLRRTFAHFDSQIGPTLWPCSRARAFQSNSLPNC